MAPVEEIEGAAASPGAMALATTAAAGCCGGAFDPSPTDWELAALDARARPYASYV